MSADDWIEVAKITAPVAVAFAVAWGTTRANVRQARDTRTQTRRDLAYQTIAEHIVRVRQCAIVAHAGIEDNHPLLPPASDEAAHYDMHAQVGLDGSKPVRESYDRLLAAHARLRNAVADFTEAASVKDVSDPATRSWKTSALDGFRRARSEVLATCDELLGRLRPDLA